MKDSDDTSPLARKKYEKELLKSRKFVPERY